MKRLIRILLLGLAPVMAVIPCSAQDENTGSARVAGVVFYDENGNGVRDDDEELEPLAEVSLFRILPDGSRELVDKMLAGEENAAYVFEDLPYGTYVLGITFRNQLGEGESQDFRHVTVETQQFTLSAEDPNLLAYFPVISEIGRRSVHFYTQNGSTLRYRNPSQILGPDVSNFQP